VTTPHDPTVPAPGDHPRDDLAAYAVDALDGHERPALEAHLASCPSCRRELATHQEALSRLIGDESPPPGVWDQIARQTAPATGTVAGPGTTAPGDVGPPGPPRHLRAEGRAGPRRLVLAGLAAAAAVVVAVGVLPRVWDGADDGPATTEVVAPALPVGEITAADGTPVARVDADDRGSYVELMDAVAPLPADRTYQLWSLDGPDPVSLGLLGTGADPVARVSLPEGTTSVAISDEPAGGSPAPSGLIAGTGDLAVPS
jgi:anti-sigma-K factor RskA